MQSVWNRWKYHTNRLTGLLNVLEAQHEQRLILTAFHTMQSVTAIESWRRRRSMHHGLTNMVRVFNNRVADRISEEVSYIYVLLRNYSLLKAVIFSWRRQHLGSTIALNFHRKSGLIRGFVALYAQTHQSKASVSERTMKERLQRAIENFRGQQELFAYHPFRMVEFLHQPVNTMEIQGLVVAANASGTPLGSGTHHSFGGTGGSETWNRSGPR